MKPEPCDVLIVGTSIDSHIEAVLGALPETLSVARLDVDRFPIASRLSITFDDGAKQILLDDGERQWDISRPRRAWFRRLGVPGLHPELAERYRTFAAGEVEQLLEGVLALVEPSRWINSHRAARAASNKPWQLAVARSVGLAVPKTWMGNDPTVLDAWLSAHPAPAVAKSIHSPLIAGHRSDERIFAFTHVLSESERGRLQDVEVAPIQFQTFVPKAYELRVTSVGEKHFTARIDTDKSGLEDQDWRNGDHSVSEGELPPDVAAALTLLLRTLGLEYAASDFIVTPTGEHVFLEANPHGAWLWLEEQLRGYRVAAEIARLLADSSAVERD